MWRTGAAWPLPWTSCPTARESGEETPPRAPSSGRWAPPFHTSLLSRPRLNELRRCPPLLLQGYAEMSSRFGSLRIVRGDNYCALRATLFQVFTHSTQLPSWLQDGDVTTVTAPPSPCQLSLSPKPPYASLATRANDG